MRASFVLPLYPLENAVLLPGETLAAPPPDQWSGQTADGMRGFGGAVVASLVDGDSVHEVGVTALVVQGQSSPTLRGVARCRLLELVEGETPLVRAERFPEPPPRIEKASALHRLLDSHYRRLCVRLDRCPAGEQGASDLSSLTWRITAGLGLSAEQQQGFLNVPDAVTRGRLLLVALRELEKRERFLRPWAHMRAGAEWN
jgi:Lon protease-like protein